MTDIIKKGDFIELKYTGKVGGEVFDSTDQLKNAKSIIVCVGQGHVLKGLDASLEGKKIGPDFSVKISPEDGFGRKDAQLIQMIPKSKFSEQKITPQVGMQLNIDQQLAIIRQVSGGRVLVDFNHPLAGRELEYTAKPVRKVEDKAEQLKHLLMMEIGLPENQFSTKIKGEEASIEFPEALKAMFDQVKEQLIERVKAAIAFKKIEIIYRKEAEGEKDSEGTKEKKKDLTKEENEDHEHVHSHDHGDHSHHDHNHHRHAHGGDTHGHHH